MKSFVFLFLWQTNSLSRIESFSAPCNSISRYYQLCIRTSQLHLINEESSQLLDEGSSSSAAAFVSRLNFLKSERKISKWNSSLMDIKSATTKADLQFVSRTSFSSLNYFEDIIEGARKSQQAGSIELPFIYVSVASFLLSSIVIPLMSIPNSIKNVLGLFFLLLPFLLIIVNLAVPTLYLNLQKKNSKANTQDLSERILYHEAGHLLAGYLCGIPIISYDITGDRDAGTTIELDISEKSTMAESMQVIKNKSGNLLVVSMAGMVSETLRFGDSKGGAEDLQFATEILRLLRTPNEEKEGALRWAVLKALLLLRIHRDSLDRVAESMRREASIAVCIQTIENDVS